MSHTAGSWATSLLTREPQGRVRAHTLCEVCHHQGQIGEKRDTVSLIRGGFHEASQRERVADCVLGRRGCTRCGGLMRSWAGSPQSRSALSSLCVIACTGHFQVQPGFSILSCVVVPRH